MRRRAKITLGWFGLALMLLAAVTVGVAYEQTTVPRLRVVNVRVAGLTEPHVILHLSDLHGDRFGARQREIRKILGGVTADAVVMSGDFLVDPGTDAGPALELYDAVKSHSSNVLIVSGNHDDPEVISKLRETGAFELREQGPLHLDFGSDQFTFVGSMGQLAGPARGAGPEDVVVYVRHFPPGRELLDKMSASHNRYQLFLSSHTHGGQLWLPLLGPVYAPVDNRLPGDLFPKLRGRQVKGLRTFDGRAVHISPGLGTSPWLDTRLLEFRLGSPAEVTLIRLVPAKAAK